MNHRSNSASKRRMNALSNKVNRPCSYDTYQSYERERQMHTECNIVTYIPKDRHEKQRIEWMKSICLIDSVKCCTRTSANVLRQFEIVVGIVRCCAPGQHIYRLPGNP